MDDLVFRDGLYYQKFTDVPFSGKITGRQQGSFKNGVKDGTWVWYYENGQLSYKGNFNNGKRDGAWFWYWGNGQVSSKDNYKNGKKEGDWVSYYENGQLRHKGNYKNGVKDGTWVWYYEDGTVFKPWTGTFKDGKKIRD